MEFSIPLFWKELVERLEYEKPPVIIFLLGGVDTGKTFLCRYLLYEFQRRGRYVALLDTDPGQSIVGPPATEGVFIPKRYAYINRDELPLLKPNYMTFVGSTSPVGHLLQCVVGARKLLDRTLYRGVE
ncbi:MAG: hypothetical protein D6828_03285, partial [Nitrospirae bacterium]